MRAADRILRQTAVPAALASLLLGCGGPELPPVVLESDHFRVHARADDWICPRLGERLEDHLSALGAYLDVSLPSGDKIDVYKLRDADDLASTAPCKAHDAGCQDGLRVYVSTLEALEHELVHAYASLSGDAPLLFEEGLATMLQESDVSQVLARPPHYAATELEDVLESGAWSASKEAPYGAAGSFTRSLVDRHGIAAFMAFRRVTPRAAPRALIDASFGAAFGEPIADALAAWRAGPADSLGNGWLPVAACAAPLLPTGEDATFDELPCGGSRRSLELTEAAGLTARVRHDGTVSAGIQACSGAQPLWPSDLFVVSLDGAPREQWAWLEPGKYFVAVSAISLEAEVVEPHVELAWAAPVRDRCEDAAIAAVAAETVEVEVPLSFADLGDDLGDGSLRDAFARFRVDEARTLEVVVDPPDLLASDVFGDGAEHVSRVALCDDACPPTNCVNPAALAPVLAAGEVKLLVLQASQGDRRTFRLRFAPGGS